MAMWAVAGVSGLGEAWGAGGVAWAGGGALAMGGPGKAIGSVAAVADSGVWTKVIGVTRRVLPAGARGCAEDDNFGVRAWGVWVRVVERDGAKGLAEGDGLTFGQGHAGGVEPGLLRGGGRAIRRR